jgi:PBP1b-binding outer membrane lipoprotein LpoB
MKKVLFSLSVLIAVIFTFSCNTTVEPSSKSSSARTAAIVTQKVILLHGNYTLLNNKTIIELSDGVNKLQIPVSSLLDGAALFGNVVNNKFQGALLFKDTGTLSGDIHNFLKKSSSKFNAITLDATGTQATNPPRTPPICGSGSCLGFQLYQMSIFEVNVATPVNMEASYQ